ncbi:MAG: hypothetical protein R2762_14940 [Bryobacteraceae bacterium]
MGAIQLQTNFAIEAGKLVIRYQVTNQDSRDAYLLNRLYRTTPEWMFTPDVVYIQPNPETGEVWFYKKLADLPPRPNPTGPVAPYVSPVRAGGVFREKIVLGLPVQPWEEYREYKPVENHGPRMYSYARFSVGYYWRPEGTVEQERSIQGTEVVFPVTPPGSAIEFGLAESERVRIDLPVAETVIPEGR